MSTSPYSKESLELAQKLAQKVAEKLRMSGYEVWLEKETGLYRMSRPRRTPRP